MVTIADEERGRPINFLATWLAVLENLPGSETFRELYVDDPEKGVHDVIHDGDLMCAFSASAVMRMFNLISGGEDVGFHTFVQTTEAQMKLAGWYEIDEPRPGCVVIFGIKMGDDGHSHYHIGFCLKDPQMVVSSMPELKALGKHGLHDLRDHDGNVRAPIRYYFHPKLET